MFVARLICSDEDCAQEQVAEVASLDELDRLACLCGCTFQVLGFPDWDDDEPTGVIVQFPAARPQREQRLAS